MELFKVLQRLCDTHGPAGFEGPVAELVAELVKPLVDEVRVDAMGNVRAVKKAKLPNPDGRKLLIDAHIDEIGLIVTSYVGDFLCFDTLGRMDARILPGQQVTLLTQPPIPGFIAALPPHVVSDAEREQAIPADKLFIDVGMTGEALRAAVPPGTPCVIDVTMAELGNGLATGKALDDRAGVLALLYALELLKDTELPYDIELLGSVQEEVGGRGAKTAAYDADPTWAVVVDVTYGRQAGAPANKTFALGSGVAVGVGPNMHRGLTKLALDLAEEYHIPYQREVMAGNTSTNGWPIQVSRCGVPTAVLSIPLTSMHTPVEVVRLSDIVMVSRLIGLMAETLAGEEWL